MTGKLYAVVRHNGQWGISTRDAPFLSCASYQEALDVATHSAAILRSAYGGEVAATSSRDRCSADDQCPGRQEQALPR